MSATVSTSPRFKESDEREDGYRFRGYQKNLKGEIVPVWLSPKAFHRYKVGHCFNHAQNRALRNNIPISVDKEHLLSIFPEDGLCPVFRIPLKWGGNKDDSPSLDKVIPKLGYVEGNLIWVSNRVNKIKNDASWQEILKIGTFYKNLI